jgi:hypothetical protein
MSTTTSLLSLELPGNGEYVDTWDAPINDNFLKIDAWAEGIQAEIQNARFGQTTLANFLAISINSNGSLKPTPEVLKSRSSFTYGDETPSAVDFDLASRLYQGDREVFDAREGYSDLRTLNSVRSFKANMVLDGAKDVNGYPSWMGFTGINVQIDGSIDNLILSIGGYLGRVRKLEQITISGGLGTKYLYAQYNPTGLVRIDGDSSVAPPASANGTIGSDGFKVRIFEDSSIDFTTQDIKVGDVLEILGTGANAGFYQVAVIAPGGNVNRIQIKGVFPAGAQASLNYNIYDPMAVSLGFDSVKTPSPNKIYIGEADWDGTAVTAARALHFEDYFIGEWRSVDLIGSPTFTEIWNHKLFDDAVDVQVQVSQANDGTAPVESLSLAGLNNTLAISSTLAIANTLALSAGDQTLSGSVALSGSVSLNGSALMARSARARWTNSQVTVSNVTNNLFYKDFGGVDRQQGFVRVIVKKLRK